MSLSLTWDLTSVTPSDGFKDEFEQMDKMLSRLDTFEFHQYPLLRCTLVGDGLALCSELDSYITCVDSPKGEWPLQKLHDYKKRFMKAKDAFHRYLHEASIDVFDKILLDVTDASLGELFHFWRNTPPLEVVADLLPLRQRYAAATQRLNVQIDERKKPLSLSEAIQLRSHPDPAVRRAGFDGLEKTCHLQQVEFEEIYRDIASIRLQQLAPTAHDLLHIAATANHLQVEELHEMWALIRQERPSLHAAMQQLTGTSLWNSYDVWHQKSVERFPIEQARRLIIDSFATSSIEMATFAESCFERQWIQVIPDHSHGVSFCASFPSSKASRILIAYDDSLVSLLALAHEIGHAYHNHVLQNVHPLLRSYPMSIAETASTFAEILVLDHLERIGNSALRQDVQQQRIRRSMMNFLILDARFLFEQRMYEALQHKEEIDFSRMMANAYDEVFGGHQLHQPRSAWIWTPHYYVTDVPFYNFPYTFGYLLALGIRSLDSLTSTESALPVILRDGGTLPMQQLIQRHLDCSLTELYQQALQMVRSEYEITCL
ncbi:M3 family metallopeptidase [Exiguobacterium acetylicum]|uniref:M3 family metallopeptidase n=1 Tax=Exiguobacterium acetylicum TaxID=41170 RepID=UPI0038772631